MQRSTLNKNKITMLILMLPTAVAAAPAELTLDGRHYRGDLTEVSAPVETPRPTPAPTATPAGKAFDEFEGDWAYIKDTTKSEWTWALAHTGVKGVAVRAMWNRDNLEPADGRYDFSRIDGIVNQAKAKGKAFIVFLMWQDYWGQDCVPAWFRSQAQVKEGSRCQPAVWRPAVAEKMGKLTLAILNHYKADPKFVGVVGGETAYPKMGSDYTTAGVETGVAKITDLVGPEFARTRAMFLLESNWSNETNRQVVKAVGYGGGLSHPDLTVSNKRLGNRPGGQDLNPSWGLMCYAPIARVGQNTTRTCVDTYKGKARLAISFQEGGRRSVLAGYSMKEIRDYAFDDLGVKILIWDEPYSTGKTLEKDVTPLLPLR